VTDEGIDLLLRRLDELVRDRFAAPEGALVNERQRQAVVECAAALQVALDTLTEQLDEQMVLVDLYRAANSLGLLTGAITREDVYTEIFSKFCIGK
jgi:tRNA modification GTPase